MQVWCLNRVYFKNSIKIDLQVNFIQRYLGSSAFYNIHFLSTFWRFLILGKGKEGMLSKRSVGCQRSSERVHPGRWTSGLSDHWDVAWVLLDLVLVSCKAQPSGWRSQQEAWPWHEPVCENPEESAGSTGQLCPQKRGSQLSISMTTTSTFSRYESHTWVSQHILKINK